MIGMSRLNVPPPLTCRMNALVRERSVSRLSALLFWTMLAVEVCWVLSLPLFPTQDGPMHLLYAQIIANLLTGSSRYAGYFALRHLLPPYSLPYYLLAAALPFVSPLTAEKLLVSLILILLASGFRRFAHQLGDHSGFVSLGILPFCLHQSVIMGFYNYALALALTFWAAALWLWASSTRQWNRWLLFLTVAFLILITHPVPLAVLLVFVGLELFVRVAQRWRRSPIALAGLWPDALFLAVAAVLSLYILAFVDRSQTASDIGSGSIRPVRFSTLQLLKASPIAAFAGHNAIIVIYRLALWLPLLLAVAVTLAGLGRRLRNRALSTADLTLLLGALLILGYLFLPPNFNGAVYFSDRLVIAGWLLCMAAPAGTPVFLALRPIWTWTMIAITFFVLGLAQVRMAPIARQLYELEGGASAHATEAQPGLLFNTELPEAGLTSTPYWWAGAGYFRKQGDVLLNSPWLELPYMMLAPRPPLIAAGYAAPYVKQVLGNPHELLQVMEDSPVLRDRYLPLARQIVFIGGPAANREAAGRLGFLKLPGRKWTIEVHPWFMVYRAMEPDAPQAP
jgi:hypothetical protein